MCVELVHFVPSHTWFFVTVYEFSPIYASLSKKQSKTAKNTKQEGNALVSLKKKYNVKFKKGFHGNQEINLIKYHSEGTYNTWVITF